MSRAPSSPIGIRRAGLTLLVASAAVLALATPARAGLGDALKKAKDKVVPGAQPAAPAAPQTRQKLVFDNVMVELTNERVDHIVAAFQKANAAGAGRPALVDKVSKLNEEHAALDEKHGNAIRDTQRKRGDVEICYHDAYQAVKDRKTMEYSQKAMSDPALREKYMKVAQENNAAAARGDSAAMARISAVLMAEMMPSREDSAQARKSCGPLPPKSAEEQRMDALDQEIAALNGQIRGIDDKVAEAQAAQGGLTPQQWGMALERIQMYLDWRRNNVSSAGGSSRASKSSGSPSGGSQSGGSTSAAAVPMHTGFTEAEQQALEKHIEELRAVLD